MALGGSLAVRALTTLRGFVFSVTAGVGLVVLVGATLASSLLYENLLAERVQATSREIARQNFGALYEALRAGSSRAQEEALAGRLKSDFPATLEQASIYPAPAVAAQYGRPTAALPADAQLAIAEGRETVGRSGDQVRYLFPVKAQDECLSCHAGARAGEVLGVVAVLHNVQAVGGAERLRYVAMFLVLGLLTLLPAAGVSAVAARRIRQSVDSFRHKVEAVNSVKDFDHFDVSRVDFGFEEFNRSFDDVALLVEKLKVVAVDRDILEFEIRLLEKFIITSNVVRDWHEFIKNLLIEINTIIEAYALVTIFRVEEEAHECDVFWRNPPAEETLRMFEKVIRRQVGGNPAFNGSALLPFNHHVADEEGTLPALSEVDVELQTKSLLLETPKIGGIVGIGVHSAMALDSVRHMVIGSTLTTLLNLVGSVKAIYKYTKDLEFYATRDPLTNLYNQRMFWELLGYEVGRAKRHNQQFAVMVLDMDNFKTINDRYGHHFGDAFLRSFAGLLHQAVRSGDMLARYGGDEFAVILPEAGDTQAHMVAQRIGELLEEFVLEAPDGNKLRATTSIGIAISPNHGETPKDLFLIADNMMYKAKKSGKNAIAIPDEDEMAEVFRKAGEKRIMIQNALERQHILPYFQPIRDNASGAIAIHELLMRIQLGDQVVAANDFIVEAESMGIVHKMDYQLIEKAFRQIKEQGYRGMLFINLSPKALIIGEFVSRVHRLAADYAIEPSRIVFEITERETVSNLSLLEQFVLDLKLQGFSFAVDDFGSGYSSFQYIKRFPVDYIKIEGEFIRNMLHDSVYLAFIKSILTLAKELGIKTIAEYVEDADTLAAVGALGIDYAQGYHIDRPSPRIRLS